MKKTLFLTLMLTLFASILLGQTVVTSLTHNVTATNSEGDLVFNTGGQAGNQVTVTAQVRNNGSTAATSVTVKLWREGATSPFHTWTVANLAAGATSANQTHQFIPSRGEVVLYATTDDNENRYNATTFYAYDSNINEEKGLISNYTPQTSQSDGIPAAISGTDRTITHTLYLRNTVTGATPELGSTAFTIYALAWNMNGFSSQNQNTAARNIKIWITQVSTDSNELPNNRTWYDAITPTERILVFEGNLTPYLPSSNSGDVWIPLQTPFKYDGAHNLVITTYANTHTASARINWNGKTLTSQSGGANRTRTSNTYNQYANGETDGGAAQSSFVPLLKLHVYTPPTVNLSGLVTGNLTELPVPGAVIGSLSNPTYRTDPTGSNGIYTYDDFVTVNTGLFATAPGYYPFNSTGAVPQPQTGATTQTYPIELTELPRVTVTGAVKAGWNTSTTLQNVIVEVSNPIWKNGPFIPASITNGNFSLELPQNTTFDIMVTAEGYQTYTNTITTPPYLSGTNYALPSDILLTELFRPPFSLRVYPVANSTDREIVWLAPDTPVNPPHTYTPNIEVPSTAGIRFDSFIAFARYNAIEMNDGLASTNTRKIYRVGFVPNRYATYAIYIMHYPQAIEEPANNPPAFNQSNVLLQHPIYDYQITPGRWNYIDLYDLVSIPATGQVWFGVSAEITDELNPFGVSESGSAIAGKGDIIYSRSSPIYQYLSQQTYGNWLLAAYTLDQPAQQGAPNRTAIMPTAHMSGLRASEDINRRMSARFEPLQIPPSIGTNGGTRAVTNYELYRVPNNEIGNVANWGTPLNEDTPQVRSYTDDLTDAPHTQAWVYAVRTIYNNGTSPYGSTDITPVYSIQQSAANTTVSVQVKDEEDGAFLDDDDVTVRLIHPTNTALNATATFNSTTNTFGFTGVAFATWTLRVDSNNYDSATRSVSVYAPVTEIFTVSRKLPLPNQGFDYIAFPSNWIRTDTDLDGYLWSTDRRPNSGVEEEGYESDLSAYSESWCPDGEYDEEQCLYPDNWLISPKITQLTTVDNATLSFIIKSFSREGQVNNETIAVYAIWEPLADGLSVEAARDALIPLLEDLTQSPYDQRWFYGELEEDYGMKLFEHTTTIESWIPLSISLDDLLDYLDPSQLENLRIAFRHWHSKDNRYLLLDEIKITAKPLLTTFAAGRVFADDSPNGLADVTVAWTNNSDGTSGTLAEQTDHLGVYRIYDAKIGDSYTFTFSKPSYEMDGAKALTIIGYDLDDGDSSVTMQRYYTISGTVVDDARGPLPGATVTLTSGGLSKTPQTVGVTGAFSFKINHSENIFEWDLDVSMAGYVNRNYTDPVLPIIINLASNNPSTGIQLQLLKAYSLTVTLKDAETHEQITNATTGVMVNLQGPGSYGVSTWASPASFQNIIAGNYTISVSQTPGIPGYFPYTGQQTVSFPADDQKNIDIFMDKIYTIAGVVKDDAGTVMAGVSVSLEETSTHVTSGAETGLDGSFTFDVKAGTYKLTFVNDGYYAADKTVNTGDAGITAIPITMYQYHTVSGTVQEWPYDQPVVGATITFTNTVGNMPSPAPVNSIAGGVFTVTNVINGTYNYDVTATIYGVSYTYSGIAYTVNGNMTGLTVPLKPAVSYTIFGLVKHMQAGTLEPFTEGATITFTNADPTSFRPEVVTSNASGNYTVEVIPGSYKAKIEVKDNDNKAVKGYESTVSISVFASNISQDFTIYPIYKIEGKTVHTYTNPATALAVTSITFVNTDTQANIVSPNAVSSNASGEFIIPAIYDGEYTVTATGATAYGTAFSYTGTRTIDADDENFVIELKPTALLTITAEVTYDDGSGATGVEDADITITSETVQFPPVIDEVSNGDYTIQLVPGSYDVVIRAEKEIGGTEIKLGYDSLTTPLVVTPADNGTPKPFPLAQLYTISGLVTYDDGDIPTAPLGDATVHFRNDSSTGYSPEETFSEVEVGADLGKYSLYTYAGDYNISAFYYDETEDIVYQYESLSAYTVSGSVNDKDIHLEPEDQITITGVLEYTDLAGNLQLIAAGDATITFTNLTSFSPRPVLSTDGGYTIRAIPGHYNITVTATIDNIPYSFIATNVLVEDESGDGSLTMTYPITLDIITHEISGKVSYKDDADDDVFLAGATVTLTNTLVPSVIYTAETEDEDSDGLTELGRYSFSEEVIQGTYSVKVEGLVTFDDVAGKFPYVYNSPIPLSIQATSTTTDFTVELQIYKVAGTVVIAGETAADEDELIGGATVTLINQDEANGMNSPGSVDTGDEGDELGKFDFPRVGKGIYDVKVFVIVDEEPYDNEPRGTEQPMTITVGTTDSLTNRIPIRPSARFEVSGTVMNESDVEVPNAYIAFTNVDLPGLPPYTTRADADGDYTIEVIAGEYSVHAYGQIGNMPYESTTNAVMIDDITPDKDLIVTEMSHISIPATSRVVYVEEIEGFYTDFPVGGAKITLTNTPDNTHQWFIPQPVFSTVDGAGEEGTYTITVLPGNYDVKVEGKIGQIPYLREIAAQPFTASDTFRIVVFAQLFDVSGTISLDGEAFAGVTDITVTNVTTEGDSDYVPVAVVTGSTFSFKAVPGSYELSATGTLDNVEYTAELTGIDIDFDGVLPLTTYTGLELEMSKPTFTVSGTIVEGDEPFTGTAEVTVVNTSENGGTDDPVVLYPTPGTFTFEALPGTYTVSATGSLAGQLYTGALAEPIEVIDEPITTGLVISMTMVKYSVSGTVHKLGGDLAVGYSVRLVMPGEDNDDDIPGATVITSATGTFTITQVLAGSYYLEISGDSDFLSSNTVKLYYEENDLIVVPDADSDTGDVVLGSITLTEVLSDLDAILDPEVTALRSNYPNPFNPSTTIAFDIAQPGQVNIEIYNIKGQRVKTLVNGSFGIGRYSIVWNGDDNSGRNVGSGVYFYRMTTAEYRSVKKMLLMK